jgi:hypothetical protein
MAPIAAFYVRLADAADVELAPFRKQVRDHEPLGLLPALVPLLCVLLHIAGGNFSE